MTRVNDNTMTNTIDITHGGTLSSRVRTSLIQPMTDTLTKLSGLTLEASQARVSAYQNFGPDSDEVAGASHAYEVAWAASSAASKAYWETVTNLRANQAQADKAQAFWQSLQTRLGL